MLQPQNMPPYPHTLPPVRPTQTGSSSPNQAESGGPTELSSGTQATSSSAPNSTLLSDLQSQLRETQTSLASHVEKIRTLETALKEQEVIRHEVRLLRDMMDAVRRKDVNGTVVRKRLRPNDDELHGGFDVDDDEDIIHDDDDMDDTMSISTVIPHQLERVDEEDEEQLMASNSESEPLLLNGSHSESDSSEDQTENEIDHEERRRMRDELGRPRTPEPGMGLAGDLYESRSRSKTLRQSPISSENHLPNGVTPSIVEELTNRLTSLSSQLESALELSSTLQAQHASAQSTISTLESKVEALEGLVKVTLSNQRSSSESSSSAASAEKGPPESLTSMISEWKKTVEGQWSSVQEEWSQERERLSRAREEWEHKARLVDSGLEKLERMQIPSSENHTVYGNGDAREYPRHFHSGGLVTPPSPRSLSSDSNRSRRRRSGSRGRSGSRRRSASRETDEGTGKSDLLDAQEKQRADARSLATPEPSVRTMPIGFSLPSSPEGELSPKQVQNHINEPTVRVTCICQNSILKASQPPIINVQTAVGVLVLSIAAAAVVWRVKPE